MAGFRDFREIGAWQLARELKLLAYELLSRPEVARDFGDAVDSGYLSKEEFPRFEHAAKKDLKAVNGLIRYLETTPDPPSRPQKKRQPPKALYAPLEQYARYAPYISTVASLAGAIRSSTNEFHSWQCGHCHSSSVLR